MKVSFKACVLRHVQRKDNTFPVYIRIGYLSKYDFLLTNLVVGKSDLTKDLKIKSNLILGKCAIAISEYENRLEKLRREPRNVKEIAEWVQRTDIDDELDFLVFFKNKVDEMGKIKYPSARIYKTAYNHLTRFVSNLYVSEVTPRFLKSLENYLSKNGVEVGSRGMTIYLSRLRAIYNMMIDEYEDLGYTFNYPFRKYKIPKCKEPKTVAVSKEILLNMINADLAGKEEFARDLFVISLLMCGTNSTDLFEMKEPKNGRIEYNRNKTKNRRSDEAFISIKIEPALLPYIEKYKGNDGFMFDFRNRYKNNKQLVKVIGLGLKSLKDTLNIDQIVYYDARRTMASVMRNKLGISKDDVALCLNHVDVGHKVTDAYIETDFSIIDACNRKFVDWLFDSNDI